MKTLLALASAGLLAVSTTAWAECAGHDNVAQTKQPTITTAPADLSGKQTASGEAKTAKPES